MSNSKNKVCIYDPLKELIAYYADVKIEKKEALDTSQLTIEEKLKLRIIDGDKIGIENDLSEAMKKYSPIDIVNIILLDGMKVVGELFGSGQMQLPFVLQSAETMKSAVAYLETFMDKVEGMQKGVMVLATVKGDVHDIGKNLVDIILTNNGYKVINLGIKCPIEKMLHAVEDHRADVLGMSGLLVKSTVIMKENLELMKQRGITIPVILGGAELPRRYPEQDLSVIYDGDLVYANDAFDGLHFMEKIVSVKFKGENKIEPATFTRENFRNLFQIEINQYVELIKQISDEDFEAEETIGKWSVHDVTSHIIAGHEIAAERLNCIIEKRYDDFVLYTSAEDNELNARFVAERKNLTRQKLNEQLIATSNDVIKLFESLNEFEFDNPKHSISLREWLPDCSFAHVEKHRKRIHDWFVRNNKSGLEAKIEETVDEEKERAAQSEISDTSPESSTLQTTQTHIAESSHMVKKNLEEKPVNNIRSAVKSVDVTPTPPYFGTKIITEIKIEKVFEYINNVALIRGQWQVRKGKRSEDEYQKQLRDEIYPKLEEWKLIAKREQLLQSHVVYGYFPCASEGDDLIIFKPKNIGADQLHSPWLLNSLSKNDFEEWQRFHFPRQNSDRYLCISDYFKSIDAQSFDVVAFQIVTIGKKASEYAAELFSSNRYQDYLYFHGLSVESAEALAEYWHKVIRTELGISHNDAGDLKKLFSQGYQGSRYSFGYPACPNLEDQTKLFEILRPERIGITLTEEYQLVPEQSTSAIIIHHPEARYFIVK